MANDQPRPSQQHGWKGNVPGSGGPPRDKAAAGPAWKGGGAPAAGTGPKPPRSRKAKIAIGVGLLGVVSGLIVVIILLIQPPKPFRLVVLVAGNETNLAVPHHAFGRQAAQKLAAWGQTRPDDVDVRIGPLTPDLSTLEDALGGRSPDNVVVVVAAHGAADEVGPFLIPEDADTRDPAKSRVQVEKILDRLGRLPGDTKKLLVLDATQVAAYWPLGLVHNDFARRLKQLEPRARETGVLVLCSSGPDQQSWVSEEWGQSIFAHHFLDGLRGAADKDRNTRVTTAELFEYVSTRVEQWARQARGSLQTPFVLGGESRAASMELVAAESGFRGTDPDKAVLPALPTDTLKDAWAKCQELADAAGYSPATATPQLWRHYLDGLLRYEQLLRAGDTASAERMRARVQGLKKQLRELRSRTDLFSATGSLAMPVALGWELPPGVLEAKRKELAALWGKDNALVEVRKALKEWLDREQAGWPRELLRVRLSGLLLEHAVADPKANLTPVYELLAGADTPLRASARSVPRPVELHALLLLATPENQPPGLSADLITQSLVLSRTAEEAALGLGGKGGEGLPPLSKRLVPWIRARVDEADKARRFGQDLLFASQTNDPGKAAAKAEPEKGEKGEKDGKVKDNWEQAAELMDRARKAYEEAQDVAVRARHALLWRDRAVAELPYYSRWVARQRFLRPDDRPAYRADVDRNAELWKKVNKLDDLLAQPGLKGLDEVAVLAGEVDRGFTKLRDEFTRSTKGLEGAGVTQENWHRIDNLLRVPFLPAEFRMKLLERGRRISEQLNQAEKEAAAPGMAQTQAELLAREHARAHGELALLALGEKAFAVDKEREFNVVLGWVLGDAENWHQEVPRAGNQLLVRLARLPAAIDKRVTEARKLDFTGSLKEAREAAAWGRRLPGAQVALLTKDPLEELNRLQLYDLLCRQADRTLQDFYGPSARPYYQDAGLVYVGDAQSELGKGGAGADRRQERAVALEKDLRDEGRKLVVAWALGGEKFSAAPGRVSLTDEQQVPLYYTVQAAAGVPAGRPVVWADLQRAEALKLEPAGGAGRKALTIGPDVKEGSAAAYPLRRAGLTGQPTRAEAIQVVHGLFRGHRFQTETQIESFERPAVAVSMPALPPFGRVAIHADPEILRLYAQGHGTVVIVFDCSGSMNKKDMSGRTRLATAAEALGKLLREIPKGAQVSLWIYGQNTDLGARQEAEGTIKRLFFASAKEWDPKSGQPDAWRREVEAQSPYNYTPAVRGLMEAKVDFKGRKGPKTLLLLTDGMDTRFEKQIQEDNTPWSGDPKYNPTGKLKVEDFLLKEFKDSDIALRVVGFQLPAGEREIAKRQFKDPLEKMPRGKFYLVDDLPKLMVALKDALKQDLFFSVQKDGQPYRSRIDVPPIGRPDSRWVKLPSGSYYKLVLEELGLRQEVLINPGDRIRLNLYPDGEGFKLVRQRVAQAHPGMDRPKAMSNGWLLTVLQNQTQARERAIDITVTAEKVGEQQEFRGAPNSTVILPVPRLALFQVRPADDPKAPPPTLRYYRLADYIAPAWRLEVRPWGNRRPLVEAFWTEDQLPAVGTLRPGVHYSKNLQELPDAPEIELPQGGKARLLSMGFEKFWVDSYQEQADEKLPPRLIRTEVKALVVRLQFPKGQPIMVQPRGSFGGQEHRFYTQAGKYTGVFWQVSPAEVAQAGMAVLSVDGFRDTARRSGDRVEIPLGTPNNDPAPTPQ
ncbi:MAG: caspase family protein [Gemmataceae bacterium]|nr:caspase family protein [Gemmataceae bacterium]